MVLIQWCLEMQKQKVQGMKLKIQDPNWWTAKLSHTFFLTDSLPKEYTATWNRTKLKNTAKAHKP